jgi:hypothetical protein
VGAADGGAATGARLPGADRHQPPAPGVMPATARATRVFNEWEACMVTTFSWRQPRSWSLLLLCLLLTAAPPGRSTTGSTRPSSGNWTTTSPWTAARRSCWTTK